MTESTITLDEALKLLSLPRVVGIHPDDNEPIVTNFGRFGPYVKHGDEFRSLESEEQVFAISFEDALALLRAPKQSRRRQGAQKKTLRELTNDGQTVKLLAGRYGPYVTDGTTNASIPKSMNPDQLTWEQAQELLAARRDAGPAPKRGGFKRRTASASGKKTTRASKSAEA
jgi:DNA topoisomerase-1